MSSDDDSLAVKLKKTRPARALARTLIRRLDKKERDADGDPPPRREGVWALSHLRLLEAVPESELAALAPTVRTRNYDKRHALLIEDDGSIVYALAAGGAKLCRVGFMGRKLVEAILDPGDVFGRLSGGDHSETYELETLEPTRLIEIPRPAFHQLLENHPGLAYEVVQMLEDRQRRLVRRIEALVFKDVRCRVAETLLELCEEHGHACAHGFAVDIRITQQDIAELVGASRQMVNKVLGELATRLYLQRMGRVLCILDRERLARFAAGQLATGANATTL